MRAIQPNMNTLPCNTRKPEILRTFFGARRDKILFLEYRRCIIGSKSTFTRPNACQKRPTVRQKRPAFLGGNLRGIGSKSTFTRPNACQKRPTVRQKRPTFSNCSESAVFDDLRSISHKSGALQPKRQPPPCVNLFSHVPPPLSQIFIVKHTFYDDYFSLFLFFFFFFFLFLYVK